MRAISSTWAVPPDMGQFSIFSRNKLPLHLRQMRLRAARNCLRMSRRRDDVQNSQIFYAFGPQFNAYMSDGILLKCFRHKLFQFE